jgi:hypothetical protein
MFLRRKTRSDAEWYERPINAPSRGSSARHGSAHFPVFCEIRCQPHNRSAISFRAFGSLALPSVATPFGLATCRAVGLAKAEAGQRSTGCSQMIV